MYITCMYLMYMYMYFQFSIVVIKLYKILDLRSEEI